MSISQSTSRRQLLQARARFMRHHPTYSEMLLWAAIRGRRLGVQFRRQQVIGNHIVDFLCRPAGLVVEVDGDRYHAQQVALDARREARLRRAGFRVLRIPASLVEKDLAAAVARVREALWRPNAWVRRHINGSPSDPRRRGHRVAT